MNCLLISLRDRLSYVTQSESLALPAVLYGTLFVWDVEEIETRIKVD